MRSLKSWSRRSFRKTGNTIFKFNGSYPIFLFPVWRKINFLSSSRKWRCELFQLCQVSRRIKGFYKLVYKKFITRDFITTGEFNVGNMFVYIYTYIYIYTVTRRYIVMYGVFAVRVTPNGFFLSSQISGEIPRARSFWTWLLEKTTEQVFPTDIFPGNLDVKLSFSCLTKCERSEGIRCGHRNGKTLWFSLRVKRVWRHATYFTGQ